MDKRVRRFYDEISEVLGAINVREEEFYGEITEEEANHHEIGLENNPNKVIATLSLPVLKKDEITERRRCELSKAIESKDLTKLENAIEWAKFDGLQAELREEIYQATQTIREISDTERILGSVRDLRQSVISELRSYTKPPRVVHTVMLCTFLLLGVAEEKQLKQWQSIRYLLGQSGKNSLKTLVARFDQHLVDEKRAARVRDLLAAYDLRTVCDVSEGAAIFYAWLAEMSFVGTRKSSGIVQKKASDT